MKLNIILLAALAAALVAAPLKAQQMGQDTGTPAGADASKTKAMQPPAQEASDVIGMDVLDSQDKEVGTVKDLFIDLQSGSIGEVIVGSSLMKPQDKVTPVPPACLTYNALGKTLKLNIPQSDFDKAPTFELSQWKEAAVPTKTAEFYKFYGIAAPRLGDLERARIVMGDPIRNGRDQKLGHVNNIVVDVTAGMVDRVIVSSGGFLGIHAELTALQPQSFAYNAEDNKLTVDMTPEALKAAPHFKASNWRSSLTQPATPTSSPTAATTSPEPNTANATAASGQDRPYPDKP